ncbi:acyltransferase Pun1-like [Lycium ferocissimum]|uniref:acyltransferase Pun1-like n=1 Tax=Lycium ferocissimum TaxID=112874 RepID=UPI002815E622|nr:acyltransferase Pun1-like [Lycium ferocissimum]
MTVSLAFFYPKIGNDRKSYGPTHVSQILEKSLSKTLSFYYPYAGRLKDNGCSVDCNDMGVELSHVRVHCPMSQIFRQPYTQAEHVVFPVYANNEGSLALTQVSHFDCGGIAIGGRLSHKIGDSCTANNFFYNWGVLSRDINATPPANTHFVGDSIYPQPNDLFVISTIKSGEQEGYIGKRFQFPADKVKALKAKLAVDSRVQNPTRCEVLSALIYKCAVATGRILNSGSFKPSSLLQVADMRQRLNPPLSHDACENIISGYFVEINNVRDINCTKLVSEMRKGKLKLQDKENATKTQSSQ